MSHSAEGQAFLTRLDSVLDRRGANLDDILKPSLEVEQELRKLFAQDKASTRLSNPHAGLIDVFGPKTESIRKSYPRVVDSSKGEDLSGRYIMPLKDSQRRGHDEPSMVADVDEFKKNWSIFTEGSLSQLSDWSNVVAAGGAVLSALLPLSEESKKSKRTIRKHYHSVAYPSSDVDLFLWGLTPEQAERKIVTIYEAVRDSVPWDVTCVRTKHTISIHSQYPYRSVQIVLRLYHSPAEVLAGFDIDAPCCAYDGERVWVNPRAAVAMMRQCNTIDVTRRSPSYEVRLAKYASRGFEVYVQNLRREDVDPTIYERSIIKIQGLARLLALEKLQSTEARYTFLDSRRELRGRPFPLRRYENRRKRKYRGDLKTEVGGLEMNDYDVASLHIPYGPGWSAQRIEKLVYQTDLGMNSTFNPKNKGRRLHRHPGFFGTIEECMEDCCEICPEPIDEDERTLQKEEDERYIRGRISFLQENPGRQTMSGSFNPIDVGEWSEQVYIRPIQKLFNAIEAHDLGLVRSILREGKVSHTIDLKNRDHVGRTALHLAILVKDEEIAKVLVDEGCRMVARLVDGRTALHLAAQYGLNGLIEKMFGRSKENREAAENKVKEQGEGDDERVGSRPDPTRAPMDIEKPSSEDDWSSDDSVDQAVEDEGLEEGFDSPGDLESSSSMKEVKAKEKEGPDGEVPEDEEGEPDVLDVNAIDWDQGFAPLHYAVSYSTRPTISILLKHGANINQAAVTRATRSWDHDKAILPLFLTLVRPDEDIAIDIAECLLEAGASSSTADAELITILHYAVLGRKLKLLDMLLRKDPGAKKALDFPFVKGGNSRFPIVSTIAKGEYAALLTLLAHGAKLNPTGMDVARAKAISGKTDPRTWGYIKAEDYASQIYQPVESALTTGDHIIDVLLELGADINIGTFSSRYVYAGSDKKTILDWVVHALDTLAGHIQDLKEGLDLLDERNTEEAYVPPAKIIHWGEYFDDYCKRHAATFRGSQKRYEREKKEKLQQLGSYERLNEYLQHVRSTLESMGAKTWSQMFEENIRPYSPALVTHIDTGNQPPKPKYLVVSNKYRKDWVQHDLSERYDELFEAAFRGDDAKVESLCVSGCEGSDTNVIPLPIAVERAIPKSKSPPTSRLQRISDAFHLGGTAASVDRTGLTPLYAAIAGKRWNTAKLIMGITAAQYHNEDDDSAERIQAALFDLVDEDEDLMSDDDSTYSSDTVNNRRSEVKFVDIAKKITLRTDTHPSALFNASTCYIFNDKVVNATLLTKIIQENNFEAFVHLLNIEAPIRTTPYTRKDALFKSILEADNPKFLDEFIRRTGIGIDVESIRRTCDDDHPTAINDKNRLYLGLNIHGKKRADLARKGDPNAPNELNHTPIVWDAVSSGAKSIIEYLASEKPLAAYKYHGTNGDGDRAEWLRYSKNLETSLSDWLGWGISPVGESPLTMAVLRDQKDLFPVLFRKAGKLMDSALHTKIKFLGFNMLLLAAAQGCDKEIFDFLLKKGVSPSESDPEKGWNLYHWICFIKRGELLEYLLERLPRDVSKNLLAQRSKLKLNTPLQIAVKMGTLRPVKAILNFTQNDLVVYDAYGFTPLHNAIRRGHSLVTQEILKFVPQEGLYLENGVGKTPYEDAEKRAMKPITEIICREELSTLRSVTDVRIRSDVLALEEELQNVTETIARLVDNGTLEKGSRLVKAFEKFTSVAGDRLARDKSSDKGEDDIPDTKDHMATFEAIAKAVKGNEAKRALIHLKDVQLSVQTDLDRSGYGNTTYERPSFDEEEDQESKEKAAGLVFREIPNSADM